MTKKVKMTEILPHSGIMKNNEHIFPVRVYYEDTDVGGVVYYANYLKYLERARSEMLGMLAIDQAEMLHYNKADDVSFVVRRCEVDFKLSARLDDCLNVRTQIINLGGASIIMQQDIFKNGICIIEAIIKIAVIDKSGKPKKLPKLIAEKFEKLL
jgi:acyl-CoA thioester hydrolase